MERSLQTTRPHLMKSKGQYNLSALLFMNFNHGLGLQRILKSICDRVLQWTQLNTARSLLRQNAIRDGLDEYEKQIEACIARYHVRLSPIDLGVILMVCFVLCRL
jgi:hypothetical protein